MDGIFETPSPKSLHRKTHLARRPLKDRKMTNRHRHRSPIRLSGWHLEVDGDEQSRTIVPLGAPLLPSLWERMPDLAASQAAWPRARPARTANQRYGLLLCALYSVRASGAFEEGRVPTTEVDALAVSASSWRCVHAVLPTKAVAANWQHSTGHVVN